MDRLRIVRVGPDQAHLLSCVEPDVFDEPVVPARLAACLAEPSHLMVLALVDEQVVGMATGVVHLHADKPAELYIDEVGTSARWQRRGIARGMMEAMVEWGRERGCAECWVGAEADNAPARALYTRYATPTDCVFYSWELDSPSA